MSQESIELIALESLLDKVKAKRQQGYRLVQISGARLGEQLELTYSFDLDSRLENLRLLLPAAEARVPSISSIYSCVMLYENELHDLFDVQVEGMAVDFHGNLYNTAVKHPFAGVACAAPASPGAGTGAAPTATK